MKTIRELIESSNLPYKETLLLLSELLARDKSYLIAHTEHKVDADIERKWQVTYERRLNGEPIAYILEKQEFYGYAFKVTPDVLIPRPETEELVSLAVDRLLHGSKNKNSILEIGTGSGAVIASIVLEMKKTGCMKNIKVVAVDISDQALNVARENAREMNLSGEIQFLQGDMFEPVKSRRFDVIIANLPYLPSSEATKNNFEPQIALDGGERGNELITRFLKKTDTYLYEGGVAYYEGYNGEIGVYENCFGTV